MKWKLLMVFAKKVLAPGPGYQSRATFRGANFSALGAVGGI
jgi:hypothetical protein